MKRHLTILALFCCPSAIATNYYFAANGNDLVPVPSMVAPWQTFAPLANVTLMPGDTLYLRRGDTFRSTLNINQGGNSAWPVVITSYGTGAQPVISGAMEVTDWIGAGAIRTAQMAMDVRGLFANGNEQPMARYPDDGQYLWLDSAQAGYLRDADMTQLDQAYLNDSRLCIHTTQWCWEMTSVASVIGDKINYTVTTQIPAMAGYAYFLFDNLNHISIPGEWKYVQSTHTIHYMPPPGTEPEDMLIEASVLNHGIQFGQSASYVKVVGVAFEKQMNSGIYMSGADNQHIEVTDCSFAHQNQHGVQDRGKYNTISGCAFRQINGIAVFVTGTGGSSTIHHNTFRRIGEYRNRGIGAQINLSAIKTGFIDSCHIHHNDIDSAGYCGIAADGGYNIIERNVVRHAMRLNNDGAALKSYGLLTNHTIFRNNFVSDSDGNTEGTANGDFFTPGIYFDFQVNNSEIRDNTIYDMGAGRGVFLNSGTSYNTVDGNVIHGGDYLIDINGGQSLAIPLTNTTVTGNFLFARTIQAYLYRQVDYTGSFAQGTIDGNRLFQPYSPNHIARRLVNNQPVLMDFPDWQSAGNDLNAQLGWLDWADNEDHSELFMNQTDDPLTIDLNGVLYLDLDSNTVCGDITLDPYTSRILINTGSTCQITGTDDVDVREKISMALFPNPTSGQVTIWLADSGNSDVTVIDALGRTVASSTLIGQIGMLNLQGLVPGTYVIKAGSNTQRLILH